mgnify:CR=1 FL=1
MRPFVRHIAGLLLFPALCVMAASASFGAAAGTGQPGASTATSFPMAKQGLFENRTGSSIYAPPGKSAGNSNILGGYTLTGIIAGAYAKQSEETGKNIPESTAGLYGNRLLILDGRVEGSVHGALGEGRIVADSNRLAVDGRYAFVNGKPPLPFPIVISGSIAHTVRHNSLDIRSGTIRGDAAGAYGRESSSGNSLFIKGGAIEGTALGGGSLEGQSSGNLVFMTGGKVRRLTGGAALKNGAASNNSVFFSGGATSDITGGFSAKNDASGNSVFISGGAIAPASGQDGPAFVSGGISPEGSATGNSISLSGRPMLRNCIFYGGSAGQNAASEDDEELIRGNVLTLDETYQGPIPVMRNFESLVINSRNVFIPPPSYTPPSTLKRLVLEGRLLFTGNQPGSLVLDKTHYAGDKGIVEIRLHAGKKIRADKISIEHGSLVLSPVRIYLSNPEKLKTGERVLIMEIENASSMRGVNRRHALVWSEQPRLSEEEAEKYEVRLVLSLGGADKDHWMIEKRLRTP